MSANGQLATTQDGLRELQVLKEDLRAWEQQGAELRVKLALKDARILELVISQHRLRQKVAFISESNTELDQLVKDLRALNKVLEEQRLQQESTIAELTATLANNGLRVIS